MTHSGCCGTQVIVSEWLSPSATHYTLKDFLRPWVFKPQSSPRLTQTASSALGRAALEAMPGASGPLHLPGIGFYTQHVWTHSGKASLVTTLQGSVQYRSTRDFHK